MMTAWYVVVVELVSAETLWLREVVVEVGVAEEVLLIFETNIVVVHQSPALQKSNLVLAAAVVSLQLATTIFVAVLLLKLSLVVTDLPLQRVTMFVAVPALQIGLLSVAVALHVEKILLHSAVDSMEEEYHCRLWWGKKFHK